VLIRYEAMGPDHYNLSDDELSVVGSRSGDTISLGDRMLVTIEDVAILRRQTYARRVPPEALLKQLKEAPPLGKRGTQRLSTSYAGPGAKRGRGGGEQRPTARDGQGTGSTRRHDARGKRGPDGRDRTRDDERVVDLGQQRPNQRGPRRNRPGPQPARSDATGRGKPGKRRGGRRK
jgi:ribonuclease R